MKKLKYLAPLLLLIMLSACAQLTGPSASKYMDRNLSVWNSLINQFNQWTNGPSADQLNEKLESRKGLAELKPTVQTAINEATGMRDSMRSEPVPEDAKELHAKTLASLDEAVTWFTAIEKLTTLPDDYTDEQAQPLLDAVDNAAGKFDTLTDEMDVLQEAYAKKHNIQLTPQTDGSEEHES